MKVLLLRRLRSQNPSKILLLFHELTIEILPGKNVGICVRGMFKVGNDLF